MSAILDTAYVNHTSKVNLHQDVLEDLYRERLVGIHYGDFPSLSKEEWKGDPDDDQDGFDNTGGNAVGRLCEYAEEGRILTASYTGHPDLDGGRLVGTVGSVDEETDDNVLLIVCRNKAGNGHDPGIVDFMRIEPGATQSEIAAHLDDLNSDARAAVEEAIENEGFDDDDPTHRIVKGVEFNEDVEWVWNRDFPGLWAANKRQTIAGWNKGKMHLYAAYYAACESGIDDMREVNKKLPEDEQKNPPVKLLSDGQLEVLCSQYLRRTSPSYFETLPVGGSLSGVDIVGRSQGKEILAQVTFTSDVGGKFRRLLSYAGRSTTNENVDLHFFGPEDGKDDIDDETSEERVEEVYTSIEQVFDDFKTSTLKSTDAADSQKSPEFILNQLLEVDLSDESPRLED